MDMSACMCVSRMSVYMCHVYEYVFTRVSKFLAYVAYLRHKYKFCYILICLPLPTALLPLLLSVPCDVFVPVSSGEARERRPSPALRAILIVALGPALPSCRSLVAPRPPPAPP